MSVLSEMDYKEIAQYLELAKVLKPVAGEIVDIAKDYGPEIYRLFEAITDGYCALKLRSINNFVSSGLSVADAVALTIATMEQISKSVPKLEPSKKKGG